MSTSEGSARVPSYGCHKPSGQALVTLNGRDISLGKWRTKTSRDEYERVVGEWLANGRLLLDEDGELTVAHISLLRMTNAWIAEQRLFSMKASWAELASLR